MPRLFLLVAALVLIPCFAARGEENSAGIALDKIEPIEKQLGTLSEVHYLDAQLGDVVTDLEFRYRINFELDTPALKAKGLGSETPFTATFKDMPLESILNAILRPEGLTWTIQDQSLLITTLEAEPKYTLIKIYPVGDLARDLDAYDPLKTVIQTNVDPDSWRAYGGTIGNIAPHPDSASLVIVTTARNHRQIAKLLATLRSIKPAKAE